MATIPSIAMPNIFARLLRPFSASAATASSLAAAPSESGSAQFPAHAQRATVAAGCFWGVEHLYRKHFGHGKGLLDAKVGYCGGSTDGPTYRAVCSGKTGHAEALQMIYDPEVVSYRQLIEFFYRMHDPTTANRQGPDVGTQYRSAIFTHDATQQQTAEAVTAQVGREWWAAAGPVQTVVTPAGEWWDAEKYHQLYLDQNPSGYECPSHFVRDFPPLSG